MLERGRMHLLRERRYTLLSGILRLGKDVLLMVMLYV